MRKPWSKEDEVITKKLNKLYISGNIELADVCAVFPGRSWSSIQHKWDRLCLPIARSNNTHDPEALKRILKGYKI